MPNGMDFNNFDTLNSHMENNVLREFVEELRNVAEFSDLIDGRLIYAGDCIGKLSQNY